MMNLSEFLTSIKMDIGIYGIALPFDDINKTLYDVIKLKTIKTFSVFAPHIVKMNINIDDLIPIKVNFQESAYQLPDIFTDRKLLYIRKIDQRNKTVGDGLTMSGLGDSYDMYNALALTQSYANLQSFSVPSMTFHFEHPNVIRLYNLHALSSEIQIEFAVEHAENMATIPPTSWESFSELATLDIKKFLYNSVKHYNEIQTAYGTISLRIDDWQSAEQDRKDLIEKWRDVYHLDVDQIIIA